MPSAAAIVPVMDTMLTGVSSSDSTLPVRQIMTAVEHKIRNLEKRKVRTRTKRCKMPWFCSRSGCMSENALVLVAPSI